jgi:hypothetical protein
VTKLLLASVARIGGDDFRLQEAFRLLGVVLTHPGALLRFGPAVADGLAHFLRHEHRVVVGMRTQQMGGALHHAGAIGKRRVFPVLKRAVSLRDGLTHGGGGHLVVRLEGLASGRIDCLECHTMSSCIIVVVLSERAAPRHRAVPRQGGRSSSAYKGCVRSARLWTNCQSNRPLIYRCPCPTS